MSLSNLNREITSCCVTLLAENVAKLNFSPEETKNYKKMKDSSAAKKQRKRTKNVEMPKEATKEIITGPFVVLNDVKKDIGRDVLEKNLESLELSHPKENKADELEDKLDPREIPEEKKADDSTEKKNFPDICSEKREDPGNEIEVEKGTDNNDPVVADVTDKENEESTEATGEPAVDTDFNDEIGVERKDLKPTRRQRRRRRMRPNTHPSLTASKLGKKKKRRRITKRSSPQDTAKFSDEEGKRKGVKRIRKSLTKLLQKHITGKNAVCKLRKLLESAGPTGNNNKSVQSERPTQKVNPISTKTADWSFKEATVSKYSYMSKNLFNAINWSEVGRTEDKPQHFIFEIDQRKFQRKVRKAAQQQAEANRQNLELIQNVGERCPPPDGFTNNPNRPGWGREGHQDRKQNRRQSREVLGLAYCQCCQKEANFMCSACRTVHYCSLDCQRAHWMVHSRTCPMNMYK